MTDTNFRGFFKDVNVSIKSRFEQKHEYFALDSDRVIYTITPATGVITLHILPLHFTDAQCEKLMEESESAPVPQNLPMYNSDEAWRPAMPASVQVSTTIRSDSDDPSHGPQAASSVPTTTNKKAHAPFECHPSPSFPVVSKTPPVMIGHQAGLEGRKHALGAPSPSFPVVSKTPPVMILGQQAGLEARKHALGAAGSDPGGPQKVVSSHQASEATSDGEGEKEFQRNLQAHAQETIRGEHTKCSVPGCERQPKKKVFFMHADDYGPPGLRCFVHRESGDTKCTVPGCTNESKSRVLVKDKFGDPGLRCRRHGGIETCNVTACFKHAVGKAEVKDSFGKPGHRCAEHGIVLCQVKGCTSAAKGTVEVRDVHGGPGKRCYFHGAVRICSVTGCNFTSRKKLTIGDEFGPAGPRCGIHNGGGNTTTGGGEKTPDMNAGK